jgi:hypothetical protein
MGAPGAPGSLVSVVAEPAGANCSHGGQRIDVGPDANRSGALDASEVASSSYVCNPPPAPASAPTLEGTTCTLSGEEGKVHVDTSSEGAVTLRCVVGPDLKTDPLNCGARGHDVSRLPHATGGCVDGLPVIAACDAGWGDLDRAVDNGCESCGTPEMIEQHIGAFVAKAQALFSSGSFCVGAGSISGTVDATFCDSTMCGQQPGCTGSLQGTTLAVEATHVVSGILNGSIKIPFEASYLAFDMSCQVEATVTNLRFNARIVTRGPELTFGFEDSHLLQGSIEMDFGGCTLAPVLDFVAPRFEDQIRAQILDEIAGTQLTVACE